MNQPTKDALRDQLALAANEIIRLRHERDLIDACAEYWQQEASLTPWQRLKRWAKRRGVSRYTITDKGREMLDGR